MSRRARDEKRTPAWLQPLSPQPVVVDPSLHTAAELVAADAASTPPASPAKAA